MCLNHDFNPNRNWDVPITAVSTGRHYPGNIPEMNL